MSVVETQYFALLRAALWGTPVVVDAPIEWDAVMKVAQMLGIDESKTAAIGDYFNDLEMLKAGLAWHYKRYDDTAEYAEAEKRDITDYSPGIFLTLRLGK